RLRLRRDDGAGTAEYVDDGRGDVLDVAPDLGRDEAFLYRRVALPDDAAVGAPFRARPREMSQKGIRGTRVAGLEPGDELVLRRPPGFFLRHAVAPPCRDGGRALGADVLDDDRRHEIGAGAGDDLRN